MMDNPPSEVIDIKPSLAPWQYLAMYQPYTHFGMFNGIACVRGSTLVETQNGKVQIKNLKSGDLVWTISDNGPKLTKCKNPYPKGKANLYRVIHEQGEFVAHERHLVSLTDGKWKCVYDLCEGMELFSFSNIPLRTNLEPYQKLSPLGAQSSTQKTLSCLDGYEVYSHRYGRQPLLKGGIDQSFSQQRDDVHRLNRSFLHEDDSLGRSQEHIHQDQYNGRIGSYGYSRHFLHLEKALEDFPDLIPVGQILEDNQSGQRFHSWSGCRRLNLEWVGDHICEASCSSYKSRILEVSKLDDEEEYWDVEVPETGNYLAEGVVHHNTGKTFTGAHFAIYHIVYHPEKTGFIGANTYDQMNQATLRELFYWFEVYEIQYVIDRVPPAHWGAKKFKKYHNILTVYFNGQATTIFTRVLSDGNPLRGIEFSWYWIDETRDTPEETHDIILSRMRESEYVKGLVTTTTAGEDWSFNRFVKRDKLKPGQEKMYGSMHVPTIKSVEYGIISQNFYDTLEASYSEMMALQELWAKHVNVGGGKAYYAAGDHNKLLAAPWGDHELNPNRPVIVGCDFNYSPSPCVWMYGQLGPNIVDPKTGLYFSEMIHWFGEVSGVEMSTEQMTIKLIQMVGHDNFLEIYGDSSGNKGTTSNAGEHDYYKMQEVLTESEVVFTIDVDQANPRVKDRVENMNYMFKSLKGVVRQTYNSSNCPLFDKDCRLTGWKQNSGAKGKLDDGGDVEITHATDGAGYAVMKKFPPGKRAYIIGSHKSAALNEIDEILMGRHDQDE